MPFPSSLHFGKILFVSVLANSLAHFHRCRCVQADSISTSHVALITPAFRDKLDYRVMHICSHYPKCWLNSKNMHTVLSLLVLSSISLAVSLGAHTSIWKTVIIRTLSSVSFNCMLIVCGKGGTIIFSRRVIIGTTYCLMQLYLGTQ